MEIKAGGAEVKKKVAAGRPKRFKGDFSHVSIQMPTELCERYENAAKALGMSKSQFGQYLFEKWLETNKPIEVKSE